MHFSHVHARMDSRRIENSSADSPLKSNCRVPSFLKGVRIVVVFSLTQNLKLPGIRRVLVMSGAA